MSEDAFAAALVAEVAKRSGVSWLSYAGTQHAVWHLWVHDALYVVSGAAEQPLPGIDDAVSVEVTMRSKDTGGRLVTWVGRSRAVLPDDELWEPVTAALVGARLNLADPGTAADEWARTSRVTRIEPTGELVERPGELSADSHAATPRPTGATTRRPKRS